MRTITRLALHALLIITIATAVFIAELLNQLVNAAERKVVELMETESRYEIYQNPDAIDGIKNRYEVETVWIPMGTIVNEQDPPAPKETYQYAKISTGTKQQTQDYRAMTIRELRPLATKRGVPRSVTSKQGLINALEALDMA